MKNNKIVWLIMVFVVLVVATENSTAIPPFTQSSEGGSDQLTIIYPKNPAFVQGSSMDFHVHIYNSSGVQMTNLTVDTCKIHIYNSTGNHILKRNMTYDGSTEWEIELSNNFTESIGAYPYIVWCSGTQSGFVSSEYYITRSGLQYTDQSGFIGYMILIVGICGLMFVFGNNVDTNKEWLQAIKLLVNMVALIILLAGSGFALRTLYLFDYPSSLVNIATTIFIALLFVVVPVFLIFLVMFTKQLMEFWTDLKTGDNFG